MPDQELEKKIKKTLRQEVKNQTLTYVTAAFGLVAGLAWNEAVKSLIEYIFPLDKGSVVVKFVYAITMTLVLAIITYTISKVINKKEN